MTAIDRIEAHMAICALKARYCRMVDTQDWAGFADLLVEDFVLDVSEGTGVPVVHGRAPAITMIRSSLTGVRTAHQIHAPELAIDGDEAHGIWAMQDRLVWGGDRPSMTGYGHYHERYLRHDGRWRIASVRLTRLLLDMDRRSA